MKELTIEQKAKRYDEAIERANELLYVSDKESLQRKTIESIFPEFKESEDETIRKDILAFIKNNAVGEHNWHKWLAWLEKQGEQENKINFTFEDVLALECSMKTAKITKDGDELYKILVPLYNKIHNAYYNKIHNAYLLEKQGKQKLIEKYGIKDIGSKNAQGKLGEMIKEMKSADKVELKFHEGDWIIRSAEGFKHNAYLVKEVKDYYACEDLKGRRVTFTLNDVHKNFKLWDITKDAKDGDVLAVEPLEDYPSPFIAIYKERGLDYFNSHCFISFDAKFYTGDTGHDVTGIHPATKEQRDTLMKAMADAGYAFDFDKKKLKKIEEKTAWSEEDERIYKSIIYSFAHNYPLTIQQQEFVKSLRPQKQWKPSEKQMKALHDLNLTGVISYAGQGQLLIDLYNYLKQLKQL